MKLARPLFYLSLLTPIVFIASGYGYQLGIWDLGMGFTLLRYSAYAAIGLLIINVIAIFLLRKTGLYTLVYIFGGIIFTGAVTGAALYWQDKAQSVPPIHDISTDLDNPPSFVEVIPLRENASNPPEYAGEETAEYQRESYPQIQPLDLNVPKDEAMEAAEEIIQQRGWEMVDVNLDDGRIEATEKLHWFGFKDDVVLRFTILSGTRTRVDMRSKSRIGRGDVGVNAERIDQFLSDLEQRIELGY